VAQATKDELLLPITSSYDEKSPLPLPYPSPQIVSFLKQKQKQICQLSHQITGPVTITLHQNEAVIFPLTQPSHLSFPQPENSSPISLPL